MEKVVTLTPTNISNFQPPERKNTNGGVINMILPFKSMNKKFHISLLLTFY